MARGRWKPSEELVAQEAHAVFIQGSRPTRTYSKAVLLERLSDPAIYGDFLKLTLEFDDTKTLVHFRKGLLVVAKALGPSRAANAAGVSRVTLYRMLSKGGNPTLQSLMGLFSHLGLKMWVVEGDFIARRQRFIRPKDLRQETIPPRRGRFVELDQM
jgi:probable addiction module antidote protein